MTLIALAGALPASADTFSPVRARCRDILYAGSMARDSWSRKPDAEHLRHWRDRSEKYLEEGGLIELVQFLYGRRMATVLVRQLTAMDMLKGSLPHPTEPEVNLIEIDREGLIRHFPELASWLPPDFQLALDPELELASGAEASINRGAEDLIVLPMNVATGKLEPRDLTALRGVAGHAQRRLDRLKGDYTLSLIFETEYDVPALGPRPAKAHVEAESILTGIVNGAHHLKRFCENPADAEAKADAQHHLTLTWREIEAYRQLVLPRVERVLREAQSLMIDNQGHWIVGSLTITFPHPRPAWDVKSARRWFRAEKERFDKIYSVFAGLNSRLASETPLGVRLVPNASACPDVDRLTGLLGTLAPLAR